MLCVEGLDEDRLIAGIHATYGEAAVVTGVSTVRRGGVLGFFSRELIRVSFELRQADAHNLAAPVPVAHSATEPIPALVPNSGRHRAEPDEVTTATTTTTTAIADVPVAGLTAEAADLSTLLQLADHADGPASPQSAESGPSNDGDSFAALLASLTAIDPVSQASGSKASAPNQPPVQLPEPLTVDRSNNRPPARRGIDARSRIEMLSDLRAIGVPLADNPKADEVSLYRAIEQIVDELPASPALPSKAGDVVVVVGANDQVPSAAELIAARLHLRPEEIWHTGATASRERVIAGPMDAVAQLATLRGASTPSVVAVEIDSDHDGHRFGWAPQLVAALQPDAVWGAVDAGRKVEDLRAELAALGPIDALIVSGAARTASPATVWDLDIPVAVIDGRPATPGTWAGLLFDALRVSS